VPSSSERLNDVAERFVAELIERERSIEAVVLFGSVARGTAAEDSDIDLLVVPRRRLSGRALKASVAFGSKPHLAVTSRTWDSLNELRNLDWSFVMHLAAEGRVLYDPGDAIPAALAVSPPTSAVIADEIRRAGVRLDQFDNLAPYGGHYLHVFAHIYRITKAAAMLACIRAGVEEYDRGRALACVGHVYPGTAETVALLGRLEPFYLRTEARGADLPWSPTGARRQIVDALEAVRHLVAVTSE